MRLMNVVLKIPPKIPFLLPKTQPKPQTIFDARFLRRLYCVCHGHLLCRAVYRSHRCQLRQSRRSRRLQQTGDQLLPVGARVHQSKPCWRLHAPDPGAALVRQHYDLDELSVTVNTQATKFTPDHVDTRIESFFDTFISNNINEETVSQAVQSLIELKVYLLHMLYPK